MNDQSFRGNARGEGGRQVPSTSTASLPAEADQVLPGFSGDASGQDPYGEAPFDFRGYLQVLLKRKWTVLGVAGLILAIALIGTLLKTPIYRATATIQIDREAAKVVDIQDADPGVSAGQDAQFYQTQYELLKSRSLAQRVVATLDLANDGSFTGGPTTGLIARLKSLVHLSGTASPPVPAEDDATGPSLDAKTNNAIGAVMGGLSVAPVSGSHIVAISFDSPSPSEALKIANAVADGFIGANLDRRYDANAYARKFLQDHLQEMKAKLEDSQRALVDYQKDQKILSLDDKQTLLTNNLTALNASLVQATSDRIKAEQLWQQAENTDGLGLPQILASDAISQLRQDREKLQGQYTQNLRIMKPAFPQMVQIKGQIDQLDKQISAEVDTVKASIKAQYVAAKDQEASLADQVEQLKSQVLDLQDKNIRYSTLNREVQTNEALYDGLLQRYKDIGVAGGVGTNNISIVDYAQVPGAPYSPSLKRNLLLALLLGLAAGGAAALFMEHLDDTLKSPEEVEAGLGLPVLGIIPFIKKDELAAALNNPRSAISEAYQSLRTALQFSTSEGIPKSLLVTSPRPGEGKSTTAGVLARDLAKLGGKVLLIDADLRNPSQHKAFKKDNSVGLSSYLAGASSLADVMLDTDVAGLVLIPCGPLPPNPVELLAAPRFQSLLTASIGKFDTVIVDSPPVLGLADSPLLASVTVGTLLVTAAHETRRDVARAALKRLYFARARMIGVIMGKFDARKTGYGYGYGYSYAYSYDYHAYGAAPQVEKSGGLLGGRRGDRPRA